MSKYLTKSKFVQSLDCPTRLFYATNKEYPSTKDDNDFLEALAKGGIQVGELVKLYYPGGRDILTLDYDESIRETNEELEKESATIYEAAISHGQCFIRVDIVVKEKNRIDLIEVKSKSWSPDTEFFTKRNPSIRSEWQKYLYDIAFQYWVVKQKFPDNEIVPYLMLIDKTVEASIDGLHQHFSVVEEKERFSVEVKPDTKPEDLGNQILRAIPVTEEVKIILDGKGREPKNELEAKGFDAWVNGLSELLDKNKKYPVSIAEKCKNCEFRIPSNSLAENQKSGFEECWREELKWEQKDFVKPHVFDIWNERGYQKKFLDEGVYKMEEMIPGMLPSSPNDVYKQNEWDNNQRKTVQIMKQTGNHDQSEAVLAGLFAEMETWKYPLHFIDFEAVLPAIPFHKGLHPYDYIPFQFSCHTMNEEGEVEHRVDWIEETPGKLPSIDFVRELKKCLENDTGTVFRYHTFENTVLNKMKGLIQEHNLDDAEDLITFIDSLTKGGEREMVDQHRLTKLYYYSPLMGGSISIKDVLPAVLNESPILKEIYSNPYSGLFLKDKVFYQVDEDTGLAVSPYKLLNPVGFGIPDYDEGDKYAETISEGGSAMMAWSRLQFKDIDEMTRKAILQSLYEYCELDTLAMVMIHQHWESLKNN
ncbi:MAG: DUF2779 domain-containing protein [Balneola sp.]